MDFLSLKRLAGLKRSRVKVSRGELGQCCCEPARFAAEASSVSELDGEIARRTVRRWSLSDER